MIYVEFLKFDFNGLNLLILLTYIPILKQVHVIHTYISYCIALEVSYLCIALALTSLPLQTSGTWTHIFYDT